MADIRQVIAEAKPMIEDFLVDIGLHTAGTPLELARQLDPFSRWLDAQDVTDDNQFYLASRIGAFICEYLIEVCSGQRVIVNDRIQMRVPVVGGVFREFDPYAVAVGMVRNRNSLQEFLETLVS